jgi:hypothetical protein
MENRHVLLYMTLFSAHLPHAYTYILSFQLGTKIGAHITDDLPSSTTAI